MDKSSDIFWQEVATALAAQGRMSGDVAMATVTRYRRTAEEQDLADVAEHFRPERVAEMIQVGLKRLSQAPGPTPIAAFSTFQPVTRRDPTEVRERRRDENQRWFAKILVASDIRRSASNVIGVLIPQQFEKAVAIQSDRKAVSLQASMQVLGEGPPIRGRAILRSHTFGRGPQLRLQIPAEFEERLQVDDALLMQRAPESIAITAVRQGHELYVHVAKAVGNAGAGVIELPSGL